jgi:hypothetical protein
MDATQKFFIVLVFLVWSVFTACYFYAAGKRDADRWWQQAIAPPSTTSIANCYTRGDKGGFYRFCADDAKSIHLECSTDGKNWVHAMPDSQCYVADAPR